jgi:2,4-didehydro-3-deoxy-L-rhamnonate hydrolase
MRVASLNNRLAVLNGELAVDVERASDGRFGADPQAIYERWDEFGEWAAGVSGGEPFAALGAPVPRPRQVFALGLNYGDHAAEAGFDLPPMPLTFTKFPSCIAGPEETVAVATPKVDWEVELVIVIGERASYVAANESLNYVAGYCVCNDVSEREFQIERGGQWMKGKGCPTFGPLGPWMVTADEVGDVQNLSMWLDVNGKRMQTGSTKTMIFDCAQLVSYISHFMILEPGDIITTGTPPGVGLGMKPPQFLKAGDVVSLGIEKLGEQRQKVVAYGDRTAEIDTSGKAA